MKLSDLLTALPSHSALTSDPEIFEIVTDSTKASVGTLFLAIRGLKQDAHQYLPDAARRGCMVALVEHDYDGEAFGMTLVRTEDTRAASALLFNRLYRDPSSELKLVAVTGTNGKTSVCHMLRAIYKAAGIPCAVIGTMEQAMTTPDPPELYKKLREEADLGTKVVFMEASSHALALRKLLPLRPDYGIFTNLTPEHLDFHHDMDAYLAAKAILFGQCKTGIINLDDSYAEQLMRLSSCNLVRYSTQSDRAEFTARNILSLGTSGIRYDCLTHNRLFRIHCPIPGRFTVYNTLAALCCAYLDGITPDCIRYALCGMEPIAGRLERIPLPSRLFTVYLDFAHTPDALQNILHTLRSFMPKEGRLTVLFGCGGDRDKQKRPIMGEIASRLADFVIVTSDNSRSEDPIAIIDDILTGISPDRPHTVIPNRREAIEYAVLTASPGDILLLSGKGHEAYEIDKNGKRPFSERAIVREAYDKRFGS